MITSQIVALKEVVAAFHARALAAIDLALAQSGDHNKPGNVQATLEVARMTLAYAVEANQRIEALFRIIEMHK